MAAITLGTIVQLWQNVSDWIMGTNSNTQAPGVTVKNSVSTTVTNTPSVVVSGQYSVVHAGSITGNMSVGTTATKLNVNGTDLSGRNTVLIVNLDSSNTVYIGFNNNVTTSGTTAGIPIYAGTERAFMVDPTNDVSLYGIASAGLQLNISEIK